MSRQIIEWLGPTPCDEECAQTMDIDFHAKNRAECKRFKELIEKIHPAPENTSLIVHVENGHDFGAYREVAIAINEPMVEENEEKEEIICEWIKKIHALPGTWKELEAMVK